MTKSISTLGTVIPGLSLESDNAISDSFLFLLDESRFDWFEYYNNTVRWTAKLVLFQGIFEGNWQQPPGYVRDTGVTVGGTNVYPHQNSHVILQPQIRCQATRIKCSALFVNNDTGREQQLNHTDLIAEPGRYIFGARFGATEGSSSANKEGQLELVLELIDDSFTRQLIHLKTHQPGS